jgi:hypothetical protein
LCDFIQSSLFERNKNIFLFAKTAAQQKNLSHYNYVIVELPVKYQYSMRTAKEQ